MAVTNRSVITTIIFVIFINFMYKSQSVDKPSKAELIYFGRSYKNYLDEFCTL